MINVVPNRVNNQNKALGFSCARKTAKRAVNKGKIPINIVLYADVMVCNAKAVKRGKPIMIDNIIMIKDLSCWKFGIFCLVMSKHNNAIEPAIEARANVKNSGLKSTTAIRVAGKDPAKIITPINP